MQQQREPSDDFSAHREDLPSTLGNAPIRVPKKRIAKACETCRMRRVKCTGGTPCDQCKAAGQTPTCEVREKARPNRIPNNKRERSGSADVPRPSASRPRQTNRAARPIRDVEDAVAQWCIHRAGYDLQLHIDDRARLSRFRAAALLPAPLLQEYEDSLITFLETSPSVTHLDFISPSKLTEIYKRYRALPNSLTDDHKALLHACFCLASFTLARTKKGMDGHQDVQSNGEEEDREDVAYFRMACEELARWNRPSTAALWALHALASLGAACGGAAEVRDLLKTMAWNVQEMGLHRKATAALYPASDQVDKLFFSCFYQDTNISTITDEAPYMRWSSFDIDPFTATSIPEMLTRVTILESQLLDEIHNPATDTTSPDYVLSKESAWLPFKTDLRAALNAGAPRVLLSWANVRFNWLYVLLRGRCLGHPTLGASSLSVLGRALSQILWTYQALSNSQQLGPAWGQIRKIVTCGHLLILCYEQGEFHRAEVDPLFRILIDLLDKHRSTWPAAHHLIEAFCKAATFFDIIIEPPHSRSPIRYADPLGASALEYTLPMWSDYTDAASSQELTPHDLFTPLSAIPSA